MISRTPGVRAGSASSEDSGYVWSIHKDPLALSGALWYTSAVLTA